jgi:hypothetical protein
MTREEVETRNSTSPSPSLDVVDDDNEVASVRPQARSVRSWRSLSSFSRSRGQSRTGSRSGSPDDKVLRQVFSAGFHDDHSVYRNDHDLDAEEDESIHGRGRLHAKAADGLAPPDSQDDEKDLEGKEEVESQDHASIRDGDDRAGETAEFEKAPSLARRPTNKSARSQKPRDPNMVSWDPDDPENPKNWKLKRKWIATLVVSCFTFISPVASSMVAPALPQIGRELDITNTVELQMTLSIFCE